VVDLPADVQDPYRNCENRCNHDVGRGMLIAELTTQGSYKLGPRPTGLKAAVVAALRRTQAAA